MSDVPPPESVPLSLAKDWLRERVDVGTQCPCCQQFAKVYLRSIHRTIAKSLIELARIEQVSGNQWVHIATAISPACELGKARYWGLVIEETARRPDGGRAGFWQLTDLGQDFVRGFARVPKHARIYNGLCLGLTGPLVSIRDCLPVGFDLQALLAR